MLLLPGTLHGYMVGERLALRFRETEVKREAGKARCQRHILSGEGDIGPAQNNLPSCSMGGGQPTPLVFWAHFGLLAAPLLFLPPYLASGNRGSSLHFDRGAEKSLLRMVVAAGSIIPDFLLIFFSQVFENRLQTWCSLTPICFGVYFLKMRPFSCTTTMQFPK